MQIVDSAFPTGAFSHSNGLETYTQSGVVTDIPSLRALITTRLIDGMARSDLLAAREAQRASGSHDSAMIRELDALLSASKTPFESYEASTKVGRRLLQAVTGLVEHSSLEFYQAEVRAGRCAGHHAVVFGLAGGALGLDERTMLSAYAYTVVSGQAAAAVKLLSLGQTQAQALIHAMQPVIQQAVETTLACGGLDDFAAFTPAFDVRTMQHQYLFRRLFIS